MYSFKVVTTPQEMVARFANAMPAKWSGYLEILKENRELDILGFYEFIQKLENKDAEEIRKAKRITNPQNLDMYFGICG
ncbi:hypothetical protein Hanom_Chr12g01141361 [Helianthus anomalus]